MGGVNYRKLYVFTVTAKERSQWSAYDNSTEFGRYYKLTDASAPTFKSDTFLKKENNVYSLLTAEPSDWSTNWTNYYKGLSTFIVNIPQSVAKNRLAQIRAKIYVPIDPEVNLDLSGYIGLGDALNNYGPVNYRKLVSSSAVDTYTVFEGFADEDFICYARLSCHYPQVANSSNVIQSFGANARTENSFNRIQFNVNQSLGFPVGTKFVIEGIDK